MSTASIWHVIAPVLLVLGVGLEFFALLGMCVMTDVLDRLHYVGLAAYGALLIGAAILCRESFYLIGDQALATGALLALLSPVVVRVTARSLRVRRSSGWRHGIEALREDEERP